jgi:glucose-6-phosphate isomerase, archaeal
MLRVDWQTGLLQPAAEVLESVKTLGQLEGAFGDAPAWREMDPTTVVYRVQAWCPIPEGTEGGLFWGNTVVQPGRVGEEYFMTHGHFHRQRDCAEYYATVAGEGALILMDEARKTWMEPMSPGSLHFIPGRVAHRVANVGRSPLHFVACWPSDAGHDYESIRRDGFGARLLEVNGIAKLVESGR